MAMGMVCLSALPAACAQESDLSLRPEPATTGTPAAPAVPSDSFDEGEAPEPPLELLWTAEGHFATRPVVAGGVLVELLAEDGGLSLVAYSPADGAELWRRPSTASGITPGVAYPVAADETRVFHLVPGSSGDAAAVEALDATTGERLWSSAEAPEGFNDPLHFCDRGEALCVTADGEGPGTLWHLDVETGASTVPAELAALTAVPPPTPGESTPSVVDGRALGGGLYDLAGSGDIARVVDDHIVWQRSPSELFEGRAVSPDYGWLVRRADNVVVLWLGSEYDQSRQGEMEVPPQYTAGVDLATGQPRWVADGGMSCGKVALLELATLNPRWLRCQVVGSWTTTGRERDFDVDTVLEQFDPATGDAEWTFDLGPSSGLFDDTDRLVRLSRHTFGLIRDDGSLVGLDLDTGRAIDVDQGDVGWCVATNSYDYAGSELSDARLGDDFNTPCDLSGGSPPAPTRPDQEMGVVVDDVFVWMDEGGLHGARVAY
jgi:outer membrane protein assembly factor BamB